MLIETLKTIPTSNRHAKLVSLYMLFVSLSGQALGSDHADTNLLTQLGRHDARIGDFYIFARGEQLVMAMTVFGAPGEDDYSSFHFHQDVIYRFLIDRDSSVQLKNDKNNRGHRGKIDDPAGIKEDVVIALRFKDGGASYTLETKGLFSSPSNSLQIFAGIRDEPFIRGTLIGNDIAAIVVQLPLSQVVSGPDHAVLLAWSTTDLVSHGDPQDELAGRAYRSQFPEHERLNVLHPSEHTAKLNLPPDVVIYDTRMPAKFPNGRDLVDDVVDMLGRPTAPNNPSENDVPFLSVFPFLAPPQNLKK